MAFVPEWPLKQVKKSLRVVAAKVVNDFLHDSLMLGKLPKTHRLRHAAEFERVFINAHRLVCHHIAIYSCKNDLHYPRIGLSVPKRHIKGAVSRNLFKRIARETFRTKQDKLGGLDVVIVAYNGVDNHKRAELHQYFEELWEKLIAKCERH